VLEALEKRDLADRGRRHTVIFLFQPNFLQRDCLPSNFVDRLVDNTVSALAELVELLVAVDLRSWLDELGLAGRGLGRGGLGRLTACRSHDLVDFHVVK